MVPSAASSSTRYGVTARRWWILFMLSAASCQQSCTWMTWSTITQQTKTMRPDWPYGGASPLGDSFHLLAAWGPLIYVFIVLMAQPVVDRLGLRASITAACVLTAAGSLLRCIAIIPNVGDTAALLCAHGGQILNAMAGPFVLTTPPLLSLEWFEPRQRNLATTIAIMANYAGTGIGFIAALPLDPTNVWSARGLLIGEACVSLTLLLFTVVDHAFRFPSRPPRYPAPSSEQQAREQARRAALGVLPTVRVLLRGIGSILRNRDFLVIAVTTGAAQGSYSAWSSVINPILEPLAPSLGKSIPEIDHIGDWLGFASTCGCICGGLFLGAVTDRMYRAGRKMKRLMIGSYAASALSFGAFAFLVDGNASFVHLTGMLGGARIPLIFITSFAGSFFVCATAGIFYESACECTFPASEVSVGIVLTLLFNIISTTLLLTGSSIPPGVFNWAVAAFSAMGAVLLLCYTERRVRSQMDEDERREGNEELLLDNVAASEKGSPQQQQGKKAPARGSSWTSPQEAERQGLRFASLEGYDAEAGGGEQGMATPPRASQDVAFNAAWTPEESSQDGAFAFGASDDEGASPQVLGT